MQLRSAHIVAVAALAVLGAGPASAQYKPTRTVEFVTHTGPGGGGDVLARAISAEMDKEGLMPVRMQVVNKTGGGGLTAMNYLAEKQGDPNTIAVFTG